MFLFSCGFCCLHAIVVTGPSKLLEGGWRQTDCLPWVFVVHVSLLFSGKWHQGVNCESRTDHCHHPLNHGFDYFYGMPFTLVNDCRPGGSPELDAVTRARLRLYTQVAALGVLTVAVGKMCGLISVSWKAVLGAAGLVFLFFVSWYASFGFVRRWNCILMRNHDVTEQPMVLERTASLMLHEAVSYIER